MLKQGLKIPGLLWGFLRDCSRVTLRLSGSFRVSIAVLGVGSGLYSCFMGACPFAGLRLRKVVSGLRFLVE